MNLFCIHFILKKNWAFRYLNVKKSDFCQNISIPPTKTDRAKKKWSYKIVVIVFTWYSWKEDHCQLQKIDTYLFDDRDFNVAILICIWCVTLYGRINLTFLFWNTVYTSAIYFSTQLCEREHLALVVS